MLDRKTLLGLMIAGLSLNAPAVRCFAQAVPAPVPPHAKMDKHEAHDKEHDEEDQEKSEKGEKKERKEEKEIEQAVPMAFVPAAILDAVKKEVPNGTITEAELEAKKGKIMYCFDVTAGDMKYDVKITVDGKFYSKKVDDEKDEKDENKPGDKD